MAPRAESHAACDHGATPTGEHDVGRWRDRSGAIIDAPSACRITVSRRIRVAPADEWLTEGLRTRLRLALT
jgi:hypothetical protein